MIDRLKLGAFYAAVAISIAVGGCMSAWDCERNGAGVTCHRVTEDAVSAIRSSIDSWRILAKRYGVSRGAIGDIVRRRRWVHM